MFSRSQMAGNATLASLNSMFSSPTSPTESQLWSLDAGAPAVQSYLDDDFQSNMTYQVSTGHSHVSSAAGLGIFYPSLGRNGVHEDACGLKATSSHDLGCRQRNIMRIDSIYEAEIGADLIQEPPPPDPFALSSLFVSAQSLQDDLNLLNHEPVIESTSGSTSSVIVQEPRTKTPVDEQGQWVLQRILEISGHTVESLSIELRNCFGGARLGFSDTTSSAREPFIQSNAAYALNDLVNSHDSPVLGINPAVILQPQHAQFEGFPAVPLETPVLGLAGGENLEAEQSRGSFAPVHLAVPEVLFSPVPPIDQAPEEQEETMLPYNKESDYEPSLSPSAESSPELASMPSFSGRKLRVRPSKAPGRQNKRTLDSPYTIPSPILGETAVPEFRINYGTPVLDAHRGIELNELKAKAARYRERNQGTEYDKKWLLSFAGKLTPQGLMTEEYRCYIIGCNQSNRRRDHILIHVGGHLDQRPFACTHCPARFLRKNECKRHELSHTGARPFTCNICPLGTTAFVRQDLLKRHQKRTHNMDNTRGRVGKRHRQV